MQTQQLITKPNHSNGSGHVRKTIPAKTLLSLFVKAGGRCSLCQDYLLQDSLTLKEANFSNVAHIVATSLEGPRGDDPLPLKDRNKIENLILVCPVHHKLIDSHQYVAEWPVEKLRALKQDHEERIRKLTGYQLDNKTTVLRFRANFDSQQAVDPIQRGAIESAIAPRFMQDDRGIEIDLTALHFEPNPVFWNSATRQIVQRLRGLHDPALTQEPVQHLSVFALGPIPLLIYLGYCLNSTVPVDLYQRHMDSESWLWKTDGASSTEFSVEKKSDAEGNQVVALLSLSGCIDPTRLPEEIAEYPMYEMTVAGASPGRCLLNTRDDLVRFKAAYQQLLGRIRSDNAAVTDIHLFAAAPAPVAVICGRDLLRKVHPVVHAYEFDKATQRYLYALKVNDYDAQ